MDKLVEFLTRDVADGLIDLKFGWIDKITLGGIFEPPEGTVIAFNIALMITETFVHEMYHYHMPHLTEEQVEMKTQKLLNRMTAKQIKEIFIFIMINSDGDLQKMGGAE